MNRKRIIIIINCYLNMLQKWCTKYPERDSLPTDSEHSPNSNRVIGSLMNMKEFSKTFNCEPGLYMNPKKKCSMWESEQEDE